MPIYDLICEDCKSVKKDELVLKDVDWPMCCNKKMKRTDVGKFNITFPVMGLTLTNVDSKPVHFKQQSDMKRYAKEHNLELGALL